MRLKKYIPDFITSMNLVCGVLGVVFTFRGRVDIAFPLMLGAAVFDFFDGLAARALGAYSDFGKELDSLCDLVSFGVLPSVMMYNMMEVCTFSDSPWCFVPLLLAVFSGLRLAKFNLDERQHDGFIGLPTPAAALLCGSLCYFEAVQPGTFLSVWASGYVFLPVVTLILCALLVCEIPMFSMKFKTNSSDRSVRVKRISFLVNVLICIVVVAVLGFNWSLVILLSFLVYIVMNLVYALIGTHTV